VTAVSGRSRGRVPLGPRRAFAAGTGDDEETQARTSRRFPVVVLERR